MASSPPLRISLRNHTTSNTVYAYVTALDTSRGSQRFFLRSDGATAYYPSSPSSTGAPLGADVGILLPPPRQVREITIPTYFAGGRIYFCVGQQLSFFLNPGPGLVEPSPSNPSDPNINKEWDFMELSFNSAQVFANITYVDFFSVPIALTLYTNNNAAPQHVTGSSENGLAQVVAGMREQHARDGYAWDQLIRNSSNGQPLRVVSPNVGIAGNGSLFANYYSAYINQVWQKFRNQDIIINTQASFGNVRGRVQSNGYLNFASTAAATPGANFMRPLTRDIFSCSTGPFGTNANPERNAIIPRLAAAFNRSTLLLSDQFPNGTTGNQFYQNSPTNHYSRVVHAANLDRRGYAFPYDDVARDGGVDSSGSVFGPPRLLIIAVGGIGAGLSAAPVTPTG